jgi:hypothetical protein
MAASFFIQKTKAIEYPDCDYRTIIAFRNQNYYYGTKESVVRPFAR